MTVFSVISLQAIPNARAGEEVTIKMFFSFYLVNELFIGHGIGVGGIDMKQCNVIPALR